MFGDVKLEDIKSFVYLGIEPKYTGSFDIAEKN